MKRKQKKNNVLLLSFLLLFCLISIITISSNQLFIPSYLGNLALKQSIWFLLGFLFIYLIQKIGIEKIINHAWYLYALGVFLLLLLFPFGTSVNNSKCWFTIPGIGSIQPSEFMKISLLLVLCCHLKSFKDKYKNPSMKEEFIYLLQVFLIVLPPSILTFLEPDTGAVIIYGVITFAIILLSGIHLRFICGIFSIILVILSIFLFLYINQRDLFIDLFGSNFFYRIERLLDWKTGDGYQLQNALSAIGSAGLFGHGFGKNPIYFPESATDFIFAVFASSFGYIASILLLILLFLFDSYLFYLAKKNKKTISFFFITTIAITLAYQQCQNIGMTLGLFPITGITLPFISYGGSSLLSYFIMMGLVIAFLENNKSIV